MSKAEETAMMLNAGRFDRSAGVAAGFIGEHVHVCEHLSRWQRVAKSAGYAVSSRFAGLQSYLNN
jgi:hypothetical protein